MEVGTNDLNLSGSICRACLKLGAKNKIFSTHKHSSLQYSYIFSTCVSIQVDPEDELPKQICRKCINKLINFYKFKNTIIQNDLRLREILKSKINEKPFTDLQNFGCKLKIDENVLEKQSKYALDINKSDNFKFASNITVHNENFIGSDVLNIKNEIKTELKSEHTEELSKHKAQIYTDDNTDDTLEESDNAEEAEEKPARGKNVPYVSIFSRFHDNERPFACKICDKRFVTSSHLNVHIKQHNGERSHQCIVCGKAFVRSEHLKGHLIIHTGQKPHACKLCPKKYTQSSHLNRHMKTHKTEL
ncbi:hypothetical protein NQ314_011162 [Rhamnusium bicolor]|uniref:Uncharacterized protein n=1 Tax=Rhamnusium bicolor TaxID=1586634 RepID=A0AAV8XL70_9CUCU|nr:hypothetical protein NQ314_011162 [Rhamnusium bicolor]